MVSFDKNTKWDKYAVAKSGGLRGCPNFPLGQEIKQGYRQSAGAECSEISSRLPSST